jgi:hypothetical protein
MPSRLALLPHRTAFLAVQPRPTPRAFRAVPRAVPPRLPSVGVRPCPTPLSSVAVPPCPTPVSSVAVPPRLPSLASPRRAARLLAVVCRATASRRPCRAWLRAWSGGPRHTSSRACASSRRAGPSVPSEPAPPGALQESAGSRSPAVLLTARGSLCCRARLWPCVHPTLLGAGGAEKIPGLWITVGRAWAGPGCGGDLGVRRVAWGLLFELGWGVVRS